MYITFNKENKRVMYLGAKKPISYSDSLELAEVENIPEKYDYLTVTNVQEKTRVVKEAYEEVVDKYDEETGELLSREIIKHEEVTENYFTCDLKACFNPDVYIQKILRLNKIAKLKELLKETDYIAIKYSEGWLTEEEYSETKALRQSYRDEINSIESTL